MMSKLVATAVLLAAVAGSTTATAQSAATAAPASRAVGLNFENAEIETLVQAISEIVGFNYVLAPDVRGKVTVRSSGAIRREDVFPMFLSILEVHGFTAVRAGDLWKIVRTETAPQRPIPTVIGPGARSAPPGGTGGRSTTPPSDQLVTHVHAPSFAAAASLAGAVRPLISARGHVIAPPHASLLIVTDTASNVGRIVDLVTRLDIDLAANEEIRVIPLQFADAAYLAGVLAQVFAGAGVARAPVIVPDRRTNSLIIRARRPDLDTIRHLLGRVDW